MRPNVLSEIISIAGLGEPPGSNASVTLSYTRYLPPVYSKTSERRYPVLYLLSELSGSEGWKDDFWNELDSLITAKALEPLMVVAPDMSCLFGVSELITTIDNLYPTLAFKEGRFIAGQGALAYVVLRHVIMNPHLFKAATLLNPEMSAENSRTDILTELRGYTLQSHRVPIYLFACKNESALECVRLYQEIHRKPHNEISWLEGGDEVSASPAELRIVCSLNDDHQVNGLTSGLVEGMKYMMGNTEGKEFSPRYDVLRYKSEQHGKVVTYTFQNPLYSKDGLKSDYAYTCHVYLPYGYEEAEVKRYPVLYLLHGSGATINEWDAYWPILDHLIETNQVKPFIAVAPITGDSYWVDSNKYGPAETSIIEGLIPHIDRSYRTEASREGRRLLGFSMGGYGALRYALTYPQLFGSTALLSPALQQELARKTSGAVRRGSFGEPFDPTLWTELNYPNALQTYWKQAYRVAFYIIAGDDDWNHVLERMDHPDEAVTCNMEMQSVLLYEQLRLASSTFADQTAQLRIVNGGHDLNVWGHGFEQGAAFMFGPGEGEKQ
jgi:enterochelin esterase-like enzyme